MRTQMEQAVEHERVRNEYNHTREGFETRIITGTKAPQPKRHSLRLLRTLD